MNLSSDFGHWVPMRQVESPGLKAVHDAMGMTGTQVWANDVYECFRHDYAPGQSHLSIKRYDRRAIRNWRHFQQIKNEVCGPEAEAVELYPAESRLADNANQYHLWVMMEPHAPGEFGELKGPEGVVTDLLIIPRDPDALTLAIGFPEGKVTNDEQAEAINAGRERGEHRGAQEPWQEGLTTGRMPQTPYQVPEDAELMRGAVETADAATTRAQCTCALEDEDPLDVPPWQHGIACPLYRRREDTTHAHAWEPSSTFDTGSDPKRQRWDCSCGAEEWTADPEGPDA